MPEHTIQSHGKSGTQDDCSSVLNGQAILLVDDLVKQFKRLFGDLIEIR